MSSKQTNKMLGSNQKKTKQDLFWLCFGLFCETKNKKFWFVSVLNWNKQNCFETIQNNPTFSEKYQNMLSIKLFRLGCSKHQNSLFWYRQNKLFLYKPKLTSTTLNFLKKYQKMLSITLFRLVFCYFRFNQNTKTLCFGIEPKQLKQTYCFRSCRN